jgi:hypothetical protein
MADSTHLRRNNCHRARSARSTKPDKRGDGERGKALKQCRVSCNIKSIMSRVAESTEPAVRKHLAGITLAQLVRKVRRVQRA